jgi:hypothetical protein
MYAKYMCTTDVCHFAAGQGVAGWQVQHHLSKPLQPWGAQLMQNALIQSNLQDTATAAVGTDLGWLAGAAPSVRP